METLLLAITCLNLFSNVTEVGGTCNMLGGLPVEMITMLGSSVLGGIMSIWSQSINANQDEQKMLLPKYKFMYEIERYCDDIRASRVNTSGWVCGLGHGIDKTTPEEHVHLFIETVRNRLS